MKSEHLLLIEMSILVFLSIGRIVAAIVVCRMLGKVPNSETTLEKAYRMKKAHDVNSAATLVYLLAMSANCIVMSTLILLRGA